MSLDAESLYCKTVWQTGLSNIQQTASFVELANENGNKLLFIAMHF